MNAERSTPLQTADLTKAFENGDLLLHYQPQVNVSRRWPRIVGYEALARWPRQDGGFVPPDTFIPLAENCGLMLRFDIWVIDTVCQELARMTAGNSPSGQGMSANVSPQQFRQPHFARTVADILSQTGADPASLTLEITERAMLEDYETTLSNIHALRETGVSLSLDDFGTGYSSLFYLSMLPIHEVKLDRSFICGIPHQPRDAAIMTATIKLASDLGLRVVAEGVELARQVAWLRKRNCQTIQGFLYGRPAARSR